MASLKAAFVATQTKGPADKLHVHADSVGGTIVFSSDKDHDEHVSGSEPEVSLGTDRASSRSLPIKVVATPATLETLQARSQRQ